VARGSRTVLVRSVPLGAVVLTERFLHHDPIDSLEYERMRAAIDAVIAPLFRRLPRFEPAAIDLVVAGGAATTAAAMAGARPGRSVYSLSVRVLQELESTCLGATIEQRRKLPGMQPDRADIMPAGLAVLLAFTHHARKRSVRVMTGGWREGVILELARKAPRSRPRTRSTARTKAAARRGR
jgi:exopolyphosphatase/guanosine-5'-triphosphate,3'-diphosphate pyrophosphatase